MNKLIIITSNKCLSEKKYIYDTIMVDILGLEYSIEVNNDFIGTQIYNLGNQEKKLFMPDIFFSHASENWLFKNSNLPLSSSAELDLGRPNMIGNSKIPVIFGQKSEQGDWFKISIDSCYLGLDIFGSSFFMLSRYEEAVSSNFDKFGRFSYFSSVAFSKNFIDRPIINEYIELLSEFIREIDPSIKYKKHEFKCHITHDVDIPLRHAFAPWYKTVGGLIRELSRLKFRDAYSRVHQWISVKHGNFECDPYNTFDWILNAVESVGLRSTFYFICDRKHRYDCDYSISHPWIVNLINKISARGHSIGLHPSFTSHLDGKQIASEFITLKKIFSQAIERQNLVGSRQHFLRLKVPETLVYLNNIGIDYDSSLGYADQAGFRCGICYQYYAYDLYSRKKMNLMLHPLIAMDVTLASYMNLGYSEAMQNKLLDLKMKCQKYNGCFLILWHNTNLVESHQRAIFTNLLYS